jgi:hypothetical protein
VEYGDHNGVRAEVESYTSAADSGADKVISGEKLATCHHSTYASLQLLVKLGALYLGVYEWTGGADEEKLQLDFGLLLYRKRDSRTRTSTRRFLRSE